MHLRSIGTVRVSNTGHSWIRGSLLPNETLGTKKNKGESKSYDPFRKYPTLFIEFARLNPTEEDIKQFADRYGNLASPSLTNWKEEADMMGQAIDLWLMVRKSEDKDFQGPISGLGEIKDRLDFVQKLGKSFFNKAGKNPKHKKFAKSASSQTLRSLGQDPLCGACELLEDMVLDIYKNCGHVAFGEQHNLVYKVDGLKNSLWVQWMVAVCDKLGFQDCLYCGKPLALSVDTTRTDRKYCDETCQMRAFRKRQKQAREMREDGKHLRDIARELGTKVAIIKKWVGE